MKSRGGPADFDSRRKRALILADSEPAMGDPLRFAAAVHAYQQSRLGHVNIDRSATRLAASAADGHRLNLDEIVDDIVQELDQARVGLLRLAPAELGDGAIGLESTEVGAWISGREHLSTVQQLWIQIAAAPIVESAAAQIRMPGRDTWSEPTCPVCGDAPRASAIIEESGEFMRGSPRYLVCGRCASWWAFSRAVCPTCGEHHPDRLALYTNDRWPWARIDSCLNCRSFIKTFDLRHPGAAAVIPLVDDLATVTLDFWALEQGLTGTSRSSLRIPSQ